MGKPLDTVQHDVQTIKLVQKKEQTRVICSLPFSV
jgi:hypothetical protein